MDAKVAHSFENSVFKVKVYAMAAECEALDASSNFFELSVLALRSLFKVSIFFHILAF